MHLYELCPIPSCFHDSQIFLPENFFFMIDYHEFTAFAARFEEEYRTLSFQLFKLVGYTVLTEDIPLIAYIQTTSLEA